MTRKHTPGPYTIKVHEATGDCGVKAPGTSVVAEFFADIRWDGEKSRAEALANATLYAAAPEMLEALRALMDLNDNGGPFGGEIYQDRIDRAWDTARAVIAKATGEAAE